ncbi:MAG: hypothetical protein Ta2E_01520 [Mycoplasmoidaceae bacterium]|nr:MAG: hypothetical protein Ta2E_01520 [Mycoplasmoidaceae bacterium]
MKLFLIWTKARYSMNILSLFTIIQNELETIFPSESNKHFSTKITKTFLVEETINFVSIYINISSDNIWNNNMIRQK